MGAYFPLSRCIVLLAINIYLIFHHYNVSHTATFDLSMLGCYTGGKQQFCWFFSFLPHPAHPSGLL